MHCSSLQPGAATTFCRVTCRFIDLTEMSGTRDEIKARLSTGQPGAPPRPVAQFEAPVQIWKCPREIAQHDSPGKCGHKCGGSEAGEWVSEIHVFWVVQKL